MYSIPCVIFAGGKSERMGKDKALLPFGKYKTLAQFQLEKFKPYFEKVYISARDKSKFDFDANFIEDIPFDDEIHSPMIALLSILEKIKEEKVFVITVDTPFFKTEDYRKLFTKTIKDFDAVIPKNDNGIHPLIGIYSKKMIPKIKDMLKEGNHQIRSLLEKCNTVFVEYKNEKSFTNINHPQEYEKALESID